MDERDEAARQAPHGRMTGLSAASLRIGATRDLETVLREIVESACALTGAACGVIATVGESGEPRDFVTSGFTPEEHRTMEAWPDGLRAQVTSANGIRSVEPWRFGLEEVGIDDGGSNLGFRTRPAYSGMSRRHDSTERILPTRVPKALKVLPSIK